MKKPQLLGAVCACLLSSASAATVVYDNGVTSTNSTIVSQPSAGQVVFDDFVLSSSTNVTGIQFRGGYNSITRPDDFSIRFHSDAGGAPDPNDYVEVFSGSQLSKTPVGVGNLQTYSADIDITLDSGVTWVSIVSNNSDRGDGFGRFIWVHQNQLGANEHVLNTVNSTLNSYATATDFQLTGTVVPIPAALWLFGSGLLGLVGMAKHKKA